MSATLSDHLARQFSYSLGHRPSDGEVRSWNASLPVLGADLRDAGLDGVEVLVEHQLPYTSKRADVVLCGTHPGTGRPSFVVVELKQWTQAIAYPDDDILVNIDAYGDRAVLHPCVQVDDYVSYLRGYKPALESSSSHVTGVAYLHNADAGGVSTLRHTNAGALFTQSDRAEWLGFLTSQLAPGSGADSADLLLNSATTTSKQLMAMAATEIQQREQFVLLDEQRVAYRLVMNAVAKAHSGDAKSVIVVTGGPGSGKSVIALSLLGELYRQGRTAIHATGSRAFTETLKKVAGHRKREVQHLFKYFNSFIGEQPNSFDVLIADEAHRIRETSNSRYTPASKRTNKQQVDELIDIARVPVFLLDEHQVVRPGEIGTLADIESAASARGLQVQVVELDAQFRSGGSRAYEHWVLRLLGLEAGGPVAWEGDPNYSLLVADSPQEMEYFLAAKEAAGLRARMSAGFCWPWSDEQDGHLVPDVKIDGWTRPWNNKEERQSGEAPPRSLWATRPGGFGQVGCVYTAQGFEFDWSGVIMGDDLVWREGLVSDVSASKDPAFRGKNAGSFDEFVRNVYKVLLTRGMAGTVLYSTDPATREFLRALIPHTVSD